MYTTAHADIRADPTRKRGATEKGNFGHRASARDPNAKYPSKQYQRAPKSIQQRKARIRQKLLSAGLKKIITEQV